MISLHFFSDTLMITVILTNLRPLALNLCEKISQKLNAPTSLRVSASGGEETEMWGEFSSAMSVQISPEL